MALTASRLRLWLTLHTWSSLISTLFLLVLFISGLPLIFRAELEAMLGYGESARVAAATEPAPLSRIIETGVNNNPGHVVQYLVWEDELPNTVLLSMAESPTAHFSNNFNVLVNASTGELANLDPSPLEFFVELHTTLLAGPAGYTWMGCVALLLLVALVSGFVVYGPHMRRLEFGDIRQGSQRTRWLDFHNLVGAVVLGWALVVGGTGMINSWGEYILLTWRSGQLADAVASYEGVPPPSPAQFAPIDAIVASALKLADNNEIYYVAAPGSFMSSLHHYSVFMRGTTARTEFLLRPVLVDAVTAEVTGSPELPGYITGLMLSQPLHFGNYGGLPLKLLWAAFDLATIALLISGLYLWFKRRGRAKKGDGATA